MYYYYNSYLYVSQIDIPKFPPPCLYGVLAFPMPDLPPLKN